MIPPVMSLRGWARAFPPTWTSWIRLLVDLPASPPPPAIFLRPGCWNEVFTDGSCLHQSCPLFRCAAWSVTVAPPFHASWTPGVLLWCVRLTYLVCAKLLTELNSTLLDMLCIVLQKVGLQFAFELIVWGCSTNFTFWFGDTRS